MPTTWIPSAEAFGTPTQVLTLGATGVPSAESFGTLDVTHSDVTLILPTGIPSGQFFGLPVQVFVPGPTGIPSGEAFGHTTANTTVQVLLASGFTVGSSQLLVGYLTPSGTVYGSGTLSASFVLVISLDPVIYGLGQLLWSGPLPAYGLGSLQSFVEVINHPDSACVCENPRVFTWNQWFQIGDLEFRPKDSTGLSYSPVSVSYSFYRVLPGGVPVIVGNPNRRPVQQHVGVYYATGTAGEGGQPGRWYIEWRWQNNWGEGAQTYIEHFHVHAHDLGHDSEHERRTYDRANNLGRGQRWSPLPDHDARFHKPKKGWF